MAQSFLLGVPAELKTAIVEQACFTQDVDNLNDLRNLSCVCRQLNLASTPVLFRTLHIYLIDDSLASNIAERITDRTIFNTKFLKVAAETEISEALKTIAELLPKNILHHLSFSRRQKFETECYLNLLKSQSHLRSVVVPPVDTSTDDSLEKQLSSISLPFLEEIIVKSGLETWQATCTIAQKLIRATGTTLKKLVLKPLNHYSEAYEPTVNQRGAVGPIPRVLFKHIIGTTTCSPLILTHLTLDTIPLHASDMSILRFIRFPALRELRIRKCVGSAEFLNALTRLNNSTSFMALKTFEFAEYSPEDLDPVEEFLNSFAGLEQLYLLFNESADRPVVTTITHHGATLKVLAIETSSEDSDDEEFEHYTAEHFELLLTGCPQLVQLSTDFPEVYVGSDGLESAYFHEHLKSISKLHHLRTLQLRSNIDIDYDSETYGGMAYAYGMNEIANHVTRHVKAKIVALGTCRTQIFGSDSEGKPQKRRIYNTATSHVPGDEEATANYIDLKTLVSKGYGNIDILTYKSPWWKRDS